LRCHFTVIWQTYNSDVPNLTIPPLRVSLDWKPNRNPPQQALNRKIAQAGSNNRCGSTIHYAEIPRTGETS
jgi:hypothetical protein